MSSRSATNLKEVSSRVDQLAAEFNSGLSMLREEFSKFKKAEMSTSTGSESNQNMEQLEERIGKFQASIKSSLDELIIDVNSLKVSAGVQQTKVRNLELKHNGNCVVVHGLKEEEPDLYALAINVFSNNLKIDK